MMKTCSIILIAFIARICNGDVGSGTVELTNFILVGNDVLSTVNYDNANAYCGSEYGTELGALTKDDTSDMAELRTALNNENPAVYDEWVFIGVKYDGSNWVNTDGTSGGDVYNNNAYFTFNFYSPASSYPCAFAYANYGFTAPTIKFANWACSNQAGFFLCNKPEDNSPDITGVYYYGPSGSSYPYRATITSTTGNGISIDMSEFGQVTATGYYDGSVSPNQGGVVTFNYNQNYNLYFDPDTGKIDWGWVNSGNYWIKESDLSGNVVPFNNAPLNMIPFNNNVGNNSNLLLMMVIGVLVAINLACLCIYYKNNNGKSAQYKSVSVHSDVE